MSKVRAIGIISLLASVSTDVASHKLYFRALDGTNDTPLDPNVDPSVPVELQDSGLGDGRSKIDLATLEGVNIPHNGTVRFATAAIDTSGNESDLSNSVDVPFDLEAPAPDTDLIYVAAA